MGVAKAAVTKPQMKGGRRKGGGGEGELRRMKVMIVKSSSISWKVLVQLTP